MGVNIWYLLSAILSRIKHEPSKIENSVWHLIVAGLIGMVIFIISFIYVVFWVWSRLPK